MTKHNERGRIACLLHQKAAASRTPQGDTGPFPADYWGGGGGRQDNKAGGEHMHSRSQKGNLEALSV